VCLAGGKQGVDHGCPLCGVVVTAEQIVLAPDGQRPDAVLHHIVVYLVTAVGDVERQFFKDLIGVGDGLLHQRLRRALEDACLHPRLELLDFRISLFLPQGLPALMVGFVVCRVKSIRFRFHIIEPPDVGQGFKRQLLILHLGLEELDKLYGLVLDRKPGHPEKEFIVEELVHQKSLSHAPSSIDNSKL